MKIEALHHVNYGVFAYPLSTDVLCLRLRTARNDINECLIYYTEKYDYTPSLMSKQMEFFTYDNCFDYFSVQIRVKSKRFKYFFKLIDKNGEVLYYLEDRFDKCFPENSLDGGFFQYPYINDDELLDIPDWVKNAIFYQILPDRFFNGDKQNDKKNVQVWGTKPTRKSFFGGDFKGITNKLEYLKDLGVNAIYLNPIFRSGSNHKYDTIDYMTIDPMFGNTEDAKELVDKAHKMDMRVILDGVFNHCSHKNRFFQDVLKNGEKSPYKDWFFIESFPVIIKPVPNYETFGVNVHSMPRLNTSNPAVQEYLCGVAEYWTKTLDIDGWRLDVADEVSHSFWREFRKRLKMIKKDIFIIGEVWYNSTLWLNGDEFDSVMNYPIRKMVIDFFANNKTSADEFIIGLNKCFLAYRKEVPYVLLNLLGSHDTARIMTLFNENDCRLKLAVAFIMTFIGIPLIYYGDELGMSGGGDPGCRGTMIWDRSDFNNEILEFHKKLIYLRRSNPVFVYGEFKHLSMNQNGNILAYLRYTDKDSALVLINNGEEKIKLELSEDMLKCGKKEFIDLLTGKKYKYNKSKILEIMLDGKSVSILN